MCCVSNALTKEKPKYDLNSEGYFWSFFGKDPWTKHLIIMFIHKIYKYT